MYLSIGVSSGSFMSSRWFVGRLSVLVMFVVGGVSGRGMVSCLMSSGVSVDIWMGMCGHVVAKQWGCHDSPQLFELRTRHSLPAKSWLQMPHVALVRGTCLGCIVVYVFVGSAIVRRRRLLFCWLGFWVSIVLGGPGCEASPIR